MPQFTKKDHADPNRKKGKKGKDKSDHYNSKFVRQKEALQEMRSSEGAKEKKVNRKKDRKAKQAQQAQ